MKNQTTIKSLIGLTQEEMAMVLGVTISQWSMFKSGQRSLPTASKKELAGLLKHQEEKVISSEGIQFAKEEHKLLLEKLQNDLLGLQLKREQTEKKIRTTENIRKESFAALNMATSLEDKKSVFSEGSISAFIRNRATATLKTNSLYALQLLYLKKESVDTQIKAIQEKLRSDVGMPS